MELKKINSITFVSVFFRLSYFSTNVVIFTSLCLLYVLCKVLFEYVLEERFTYMLILKMSLKEKRWSLKSRKAENLPKQGRARVGYAFTDSWFFNLGARSTRGRVGSI